MVRHNPPRNALDVLPPEMLFEIFSYLDLPSVGNVRCACKRWKLVIETSRMLEFAADLTDVSLPTLVNSTKRISTLRIHNFSGKHNTVVSSTRGSGRLFAYADILHLIGDQINCTELGRMMYYAVDSVRELVFENCRPLTLRTVFDFERPFASLRKLSIIYTEFPTRKDTRLLRNLADLESGPNLPRLEHFKILYELDDLIDIHREEDELPCPYGLFANYLALSRAIASLRNSLRIVEILRGEIIRTAFVLHVDTLIVRPSQMQRRQMQECLAAFDEMRLEVFKASLLLDEGEDPWTLETALMQKQRNLKELEFDKKLCFPRAGSQNLVRWFPNTISSLTTVKISTTCFDTEHVDLNLFSQCTSLNSLWLTFYRGVRLGPAIQNTLRFANVDTLPTSITSLKLKSSQTDAVVIHQQSLLTNVQIRWIISNLRKLECLWLQLVMEEVSVPNPVDNDPEAAAAAQLLQEQNANLNVNSNINLDTFRGMVRMPKIKEMKFDLLTARQLAATLELGPDGNPRMLPDLPASPEDVQSYIQICDEVPRVKLSQSEIAYFPFRFVEMSITKK